jgi:hypothetical protein
MGFFPACSLNQLTKPEASNVNLIVNSLMGYVSILNFLFPLQWFDADGAPNEFCTFPHSFHTEAGLTSTAGVMALNLRTW